MHQLFFMSNAFLDLVGHPYAAFASDQFFVHISYPLQPPSVEINVCLSVLYSQFPFIKIIVRLTLTKSYRGFSRDSQPISTANLRGNPVKQTIEIVT